MNWPLSRRLPSLKADAEATDPEDEELMGRPAMPERTCRTSRLPRMPRSEDIRNYAVVRLTRAVKGAGGVHYPVGTIGVIVECHDDGVGYEVEFETPQPGVATLDLSDFELADSARQKRFPRMEQMRAWLRARFISNKDR